MKYWRLLMVLVVVWQNNAEASPTCLNGIRASSPYGKAELHKLFFHVYDAEFWSEVGVWNMQTPHALHLTYHVDIDSEDFVERSLEELERNPNVAKQELADFAKMLPKLMPNVVEGDSITAMFNPKSGLQFCHNNQSVGSIENAKMAEAFLGIWLSEYTSEPDMRKKLLQLP